MSKLDPTMFKFALNPNFLTDPEVDYLDFEDGWKQWDLATNLLDRSLKCREELYETRPQRAS